MKEQIHFIDLGAQQKRIRHSLDERIGKVLDHGAYIMGPEIKELEKKLSEYLNISHSISCANGTDALLMVLMAYGIGPGHAVFTTPFTFIATAEVISLLGATPIFVDIEEDTYNISPEKLSEAIEKVNSAEAGLQPKGIIAVDIFGQSADYDAIGHIAKQHNLFLVQDAAQSFGCLYKGKHIAHVADVATTSFFPAKPLGCYGDGGAIFCKDDLLAEKLRSIRVHGQGKDKYHNVRVGINGRLDTLQAAILLSKLEVFPEEVELRNKVARHYTEALQDILVTPFVRPDCLSVWAQYTLLCESAAIKNDILSELSAQNIPTAIYYPVPLHVQDAFSSLGYAKGHFPISETIAERVFSIPMHPYLTEEQQDSICSVIRSAAEKASVTAV